MISKPKTPRSWRCSVCQSRNLGSLKTCPSCKTRRGTGRTNTDARMLKLWADRVKNRDDWTCRRCGRAFPGKMQAAHIIHKAKSRNTRWDIRNGLTMCAGPGTNGCHFWFDHRADDLERGEFVVSKIGRATYNDLQRLRLLPWDKDMSRPLRELKSL